MDLSILIASFEARDALVACLAALGRALEATPTLEIEIIIVDNGSRDGSLQVARDSPLRPRLVASAENRGFASAINRGWRLSRGRHLLLLNTDVEVDPEALAAGVALLDGASEIGVVGAALRHADGRPQRSVHALPGWQSELFPDIALRQMRPAGFDMGGSGRLETGGRSGKEGAGSRGVRDVEAVRGAVFFIRGGLAEKLGRLDERYFFFLEETDYCRRVRAAGFRVVQAGAVRAKHGLGESSKRRAPLATRIEFHRSLYRYLDVVGGSALRRVARAVRTARSGGSLLLLAPLCLISEAARRRFSERFGLVLWHLRGCPSEPSLAEALRREDRTR
ncbi:MAG: glycosyltransferase [Myxococcota bacterium]